MQDPKHMGNVLLLRAAALWLLVALVLAWCLVGLHFGIPAFKAAFPGKVTRVVQAHLDFLVMSALLFGFYAAKARLAWHVRWAMAIGAFTNSSLFLAQALFPFLDSPEPPQGIFAASFAIYLMASILITSYGFGKGAVTVLKSTFEAEPQR